MLKNKNITIIMKPTPACNIRCRHCYHEEYGYTGETMTDEILEKSFSAVMPYFKRVTYIWHGGEQLLMSLEFYKRALELQKKFIKKYNTVVENHLQTNGTLINDEIADFIKVNNIKTGISFDGPYNSFLRQDTEKTLNGIKILDEKKINYGFLAIISSGNVNNLIETYEYFKKKNRGLKLNPVFNSGETKNNSEILLNVEQYISKFNELFDYWLLDKKCNIHVNPILEYVRLILKNEKKSCYNSSCLFGWLNIQSDGKIFPCGRVYPQEYLLGDIRNCNDIREVFNSSGYKELLKGSIERRNNCLSNCSHYSYCEGGCNSDALTEGNISKSGGFACKCYCAILEHVKEKLDDIKSEKIDINLLNPFIKELMNIDV